jgi:hypothetical protein
MSSAIAEPVSALGSSPTLPRPAKRCRRKPQWLKRTRVSHETLARRAEFLPPEAAALVRLHLDLGITIKEIAAFKGMPERQVRRRLARLCERLADPCFVLAARFRHTLAPGLAELAAAYWIEDLPLRQLAHSRGQSVYGVRQEIAKVRSLLLLALANEGPLPPELATAALNRQPTAQR